MPVKLNLSTNIWTLVAMFGLLWVIRAFFHVRRPGRPGPPGLPIIGNLHQMTSRPHLLFSEWAKKYGDVFYLRMGSVDWMILSSAEAIHETMVKRATLFSDRPYQELSIGILSEGGQGIVTANYGEKWRERRKRCNLFMSKTAVRGYTGFLTYEARALCKTLLKEGQEHGTRGAPIRAISIWHSINTIMSLIYGTRYASYTDERVVDFGEKTHLSFKAASPAYHPADLLPWLWPFFEKRRRQVQKSHDEWYYFQVEALKRYRANRERIDAGIPTTMVRCIVDAMDAKEIPDDKAHVLLGEMVPAGIHTISLSLTWFTHVLTTRLDVQDKVHKEMDRVIGKDRLPTLEDASNLPYFLCVLQESLRLYSPSQFIMPHMVREDTEYRGVPVKRGTWVFINLNAVHKAFSKEEDAHEFRPERWEANPKTLSEEILGKQGERRSWSFGGGRRVCAGIYYAEAVLTLSALHLLWAFRLQEGDGVKIDLEELEDGILNPPPPYRIQYIPRGPHVQDLLMQDDLSTPVDTI
ncbi:MAG: cytochrome P450 [Piptocephalis tieghemiana]|nr:MAG: cytochrome P450 [Piptocephalis tieghemiana]